MSVILTNGLRGAKLAYPAIAAHHSPKVAAQIGQTGVKAGLAQAANAFAHTYWVAFALIVVTVAVAFLLPRKREESNPLDEQSEMTPLIVH
jgi:hypothetical protein